MLILDDEEERPIRRPRIYHERINFIMPTNQSFLESFRVDRLVVERIERHIGRFIQRNTRRSHALSVRQQILVTLHFLGNGSLYHLNGYSLGLSKSTICQCIHIVCGLIMRYVMPLYVRWPSNANDIDMKFQRRAGFPHVKGIIDGTLIHIDAPHFDEPIYVSRHNKHAINLLVVSGPQHEFFYASAKCPGSFHDSRCLQVSSLWQSWQTNGWRPGNDNRSIILGDSAYPLTNWLMTPTIRLANRQPHLDNACERYLRKHRSTRFMVENAIGILKHQFYCMRYGFRFTQPARVVAAIYTCIALHNMQNYSRNGSYDYDAELNRIAHAEPDHGDQHDNNHQDQNNPNLRIRVDGIARQRELIEFFVRRPQPQQQPQ